MLRLLPLWLVSLALLLGSCKKDSPDPEPTLEGDWNDARVTWSVYNPARVLTKQNTQDYQHDPYVYYTRFTSTSSQRFLGNGTVYDVPQAFTRRGDTLALASGVTYYITQLTAEEVTLEYRAVGYLSPATQDSLVTTFHYLRR
ncbi:hypothetical protein [uncultured Hymenobacter sp.]|uniref:hypothetical protein n=1 Tax=uncultured Hymenobacter sp. TaxID=170016 RepID=UPI0035C9CA5C